MAQEITISMLANVCCSEGMSVGRWNACTAWKQYDLKTAKDRAFIRLHSLTDSPPLSRTVDSIARAYDLDAPADGTEKVFELPEQMLAQQVSSIIEWLTPQLLELADE